ncbi:MAG: LPS export ABC transporter periplasmic protein LptC [Burkholderiaceae bacterium]|nr:LPS export ABC transporter periplasmic protein LptC [Burkholderiaceae bacterium]
MAAPELHLPDLPEVTVNLAALRRPAQRPHLSWRYRLQQALTAYLPLGLMALLAVGTWWLVRHTPGAAPPPAAAAPRKEPDYTMSGFSVSRFNAEGRLVLRISGDQLRHYPDTDRMEIEGVKIQAIAPDGRVTDASARRALANGDGSEIQLLGGAQVLAPLPDGDTLEVQGEFLHAFTRFERLRSHLPVRVRRGGSDIRAGGLDYEHPTGLLQLAGPVRATLLPRRPPLPTPPAPAKDAAR